MTEEGQVTRLSKALNAPKSVARLKRYDAYYEGEQPLRFITQELVAEFGDRVTTLVLNWCRLGADAYENRLDIESFRYRGDDSGDGLLWEIWQANNGDEQSQQAHLEALIMGRSYVIVGSGDDDGDPPVMTVESPLQVVTEQDPRTRKVSSALKEWTEDDKSRARQLLLPDVTVTYRRDRREWVEVERDEHEMGRVCVVPLLNRGRILRQLGVSEFHDVMLLADAANKMGTDMMISGEFHGMPRRWVVGMGPEDFKDSASGQQMSQWSAVAGRIWGTNKKPQDVQMGQFSESDLAVFHGTIRMLAQSAAQLLALPPHYMSFTTDNPTSADAIRSSEAQLVKRIERKQTVFGGAWEDVQRLILRIQTGVWDPKARSLETDWRDASTPTVAQKADAVVKLRQAGVLPVEFARQALGYTDEQRRRMREADATDPPPPSPAPPVIP